MCRDLDWERLRAEYETGSTQSELSRRYDVSRKAIQKHIAKEGWVQGDVREEVERLAEAKVAGVVAPCDPQKRAEAIGVASDKLASIKLNQRRLVDEALVDWEDKWKHGTFEDGKKVKIFAESLKLLLEEQRRVYGITDKDGQDKKDKVYKVVLADEEQEF